MRDIPIIFSAPMVRALIDGRKTQTRRLASSPLAKVQPGDRLWVRETWAETWEKRPWYRATPEDGLHPIKPIPSIHMPRWASRLTLLVEGVKVERLQDISRNDAQAEGATSRPNCNGFMSKYDGWSMEWDQVGKPSHFAPDGRLTERCISLGSADMAFANYWIKLHGELSWDENPWVVALTFRVIRSNIDAIPSQEAA